MSPIDFANVPAYSRGNNIQTIATNAALVWGRSQGGIGLSKARIMRIMRLMYVHKTQEKHNAVFSRELNQWPTL